MSQNSPCLNHCAVTVTDEMVLYLIKQRKYEDFCGDTDDTKIHKCHLIWMKNQFIMTIWRTECLDLVNEQNTIYQLSQTANVVLTIKRCFQMDWIQCRCILLKCTILVAMWLIFVTFETTSMIVCSMQDPALRKNQLNTALSVFLHRRPCKNPLKAMYVNLSRLCCFVIACDIIVTLYGVNDMVDSLYDVYDRLMVY